MGSRKKVTIGYRYFMGIHMGFCRGPVDELVQINVGGKEAFGPKRPGFTRIRKSLGTSKKAPGKKGVGLVSSPLTGGYVHIMAPGLFGGEKREGGIDGEFHFLTGEATQVVPTGLKALLGGLVPEFRGVCTGYYDGLVSAMNPYPKRWSVRLRRVLKGWDNDDPWYPEKALISLESGKIKAMNPAHILLECQTNRDWGRGKHRSLLDLESYQKAADALHAEDFGLCLKWRRTDDITRFENLVLEHIGAAHYLSRSTGLWTLRLIREDYKKDDVPLFKQGSGLLAIDEQRTPALDSSANQFIIKYKDPTDGQIRQTRAKNLGAIQQAGGTITTTKEYPGIPTPSLAARVAARDCFTATANLRTLKIRTDRRGAALNPADVIRIEAKERGIIGTVFRIGTIDYGSLDKGEITLQVVEDLFNLPESGTGDTQAPTPPPATSVEPVTVRRLIEASWYDLACELEPADLQQVQDQSAALGVLAARPSGNPTNFALLARAGSTPFDEIQTGDFCPHALVIEDIPQGAAPVTVTLMDAQDLEQAQAGGAVLIDDEVFALQGYDEASGQVTLTRGCADSVPAAHTGGARLWFIEGNTCLTEASYFSGETVQARLLTKTLSETLDESLAPIDGLTLAARQNRPYPPGNLKINGAAYPETISGALTLSWASRNRLLQADQLLDTQADNITTEPNVTYSLRIYGETGQLRKSADGLTTLGFIWPEDDEKAASNLADTDGNPRLNASLRIELWSVRDGLASTQKHNITVTRNLP